MLSFMKRCKWIGLLLLLYLCACSLEEEGVTFELGELIKGLDGLFVTGKFDVAGNLHVCALDRNYVFESRCNIKYAIKTQGEWNSVIVDTANFSSDEEREIPFVNFDIDESSDAHIAYIKGDKVLKYATNKDGAWIFENVEYQPESNDIHIYSPIWLILDSEEKPRIAFIRSSPDDDKIVLARKEANNWKFEDLKGEMRKYIAEFMAVSDSEKNIHVVSSGCKDCHERYKLTYIKDALGEGEESVIDSIEGHEFKSIWVYPSDDEKVYVSYVLNRKLKYAIGNGSSWSVKETDFERIADVGTSIISDGEYLYLAFIMIDAKAEKKYYKLFLARCKEEDCELYKVAQDFVWTIYATDYTPPLNSPILISDPKGNIHLLYAGENGVRHVKVEEVIKFREEHNKKLNP